MSSNIATAFLVLSQKLTTQEALSGVFGSVSLATWIFLLVCGLRLQAAEPRLECIINTIQVPQLILNYKTGSADGISLAFLTVWLVGDATNLAGV